MSKLRSIVFVLGLAGLALGGCTSSDPCASGECITAQDPGVVPPVRTCQRACANLVGACDVTSETDPAIKLDLSGCVDDCRGGTFGLAETDCLAAKLCGAPIDDCLAR